MTNFMGTLWSPCRLLISLLLAPGILLTAQVRFSTGTPKVLGEGCEVREGPEVRTLQTVLTGRHLQHHLAGSRRNRATGRSPNSGAWCLIVLPCTFFSQADTIAAVCFHTLDDAALCLMGFSKL